jgi:hypothetical protein
VIIPKEVSRFARTCRRVPGKIRHPESQDAGLWLSNMYICAAMLDGNAGLTRVDPVGI